LLAACFFAAGDPGGGASGAIEVGGAGGAAAWAGRPGAAAFAAPAGLVPVPGSGDMMLTAGVLAALGNSALVGRPVGIDGGSIAIGELAAATGGAFQDGA
jgi:hypothetical protein